MASGENGIFGKTLGLLKAQAAFTVCQVIDSVGSSPRRAGARMLVYPDGRIEYTLGGGAVEGRVIREAILAIPKALPFVREYHLGDLGMHCGGIMRVLFEPAVPEDVDFYEAAAQRIASRKPFVLAYHLDDTATSPLPKAVFAESGCVWDGKIKSQSFLNSALELLQHERMTTLQENVYLCKVLPQLRLLIFGGGHVGAALAEVAGASKLFDVTLVDDRPEFVDPEQLPFCQQVILAPHNFKGGLPRSDAHTFVAVITRCHATDKVVLDHLLRTPTPAAYLGMIGSVPKRAQLFRQLIDDGIEPEQLERVTTPMGIPIGGKTPGEIAISMLAEMIQQKNRMEGELEGGTAKWSRSKTAVTTR